MRNETWRLLQLFADGGTTGGEGGAEGAAAGENGADAGHAQTPGRMTWEQVKADPEYSAHMQQMVRQRLKNAKQAQEAMDTLSPALTAMARAYGQDPQNPDYAALAKAVAEDTRYTSGKAAPQAAGEDAALHSHYQSLVRQAQALKARYPDFDLHRELKNPVFLRMTAPNTGVSLEDAYYTVHRREIGRAAMEAATRQTARRISNAIRSGTARPQENGTAAPGPSVTAFDYRNATPEQRQALKARIRQAVARGEKVYPGSI